MKERRKTCLSNLAEIKMKSLIRKTFFLAILSGILFSPLYLNAADSPTYQLLAPIGSGQDKIESVGTGSDFGHQAQRAITFVVGFAAALAVLMIVVGGFQYMLGESIGMKSAGRERATSAVLGLGLLLVSWLILNTINPDLLTLDLSIPEIQIDSSLDGGSNTGAPVTDNALSKPVAFFPDPNNQHVMQIESEGNPCPSTLNHDGITYNYQMGVGRTIKRAREFCQYSSPIRPGTITLVRGRDEVGEIDGGRYITISRGTSPGCAAFANYNGFSHGTPVLEGSVCKYRRQAL